MAEEDQNEAGRQNRARRFNIPTLGQARADAGSRRAQQARENPDFRQAFQQGLQQGGQFARDRFIQDTQPRISQALDLREQFATQGLGAPALSGIRAGAVGGINQQLAQNLSNLRAQQAASGVRGAATGFQAQRAMQDAQNARAAFENQLLAQDVGFRSNNLGQLQNALSRERFGDISTRLGFGGLGIQQAAATGQQALGGRFLDIAEENLRQQMAARLNPTGLQDPNLQSTLPTPGGGGGGGGGPFGISGQSPFGINNQQAAALGLGTGVGVLPAVTANTLARNPEAGLLGMSTIGALPSAMFSNPEGFAQTTINPALPAVTGATPNRERFTQGRFY